MAVDPDLISNGLDELAAEATPLRATASSIARRIRTRRRNRLTATAAGCAAVALVATLAAWPHGGTHPPDVTSAAAAVPKGQRAVSYHGIEVLVPASWPLNALHCSTPTRNTVTMLDNIDIAFCLVARPPAVDTVSLGSYQNYARTTAMNPPPAPRSSKAETVVGRAATLTETALASGQTEVTLSIPDLNVVVTAQTSDPAFARRLIASVRLARPLDINGCADPLGDLTPAPSPQAASELAPAGFQSASICVYTDLRLTHSVKLAKTDALALAAILNGSRPGLQTSGPVNEPPKSSDPQPCTPYDDAAHRNGYLIRFTFPGGPTDVAIRSIGCVDLGATNGIRTGHLTQPLLNALGKLSGIYPSYGALEDLLPR